MLTLTVLAAGMLAGPFAELQLSTPAVANADVCKALEQSARAAELASDWAMVERFGLRQLTQCQVTAADDVARLRTRIADAQLQQGNAKAALDHLDACIDASYLDSACHVLKVRALLDLGEREPARDAARVARSIIEQNIQAADTRLTPDPAHRQRHASETGQQRLYLTLLERMLVELTPAPRKRLQP